MIEDLIIDPQDLTFANDFEHDEERRVIIYHYELRNKIKSWLDNHCEGFRIEKYEMQSIEDGFLINAPSIIFTNKEEATLFKLKWM